MRQILSLIRWWAVVTVCLLSVSPALAQRSVADKAAAEALFDEALELMKDKRYAEACPKLEESQRIDAGIGTLLYLAECYEKTGRTASAWATFREAASAASAAGQADRARQGKSRADRLEEGLSKLTIMVAPENKTLDGFRVVRAGELVQPPLFDAAVPVDPGQMTIEASAPGYETYTKTVTVPANGGRGLIQIPPLAAQPGTAAGIAAPPPTSPGSRQATPANPNDQSTSPGADLTADAGTSDGGTSRTVGVVLMGVGAAGVVVGSIFGVDALRKKSDADDECGDTTCNTEEGAKLNEDAQDAALISTIGFVAGAGALLAGGIIYFTAPDGTETGRMELNPIAGGAQFSFSGRF